jgi:hypothetical protein
MKGNISGMHTEKNDFMALLTALPMLDAPPLTHKKV